MSLASVKGLQSVDGFAELLTIGFPGSVGFLGTAVFHKTHGSW